MSDDPVKVTPASGVMHSSSFHSTPIPLASSEQEYQALLLDAEGAVARLTAERDAALLSQSPCGEDGLAAKAMNPINIPPRIWVRGLQGTRWHAILQVGYPYNSSWRTTACGGEILVERVDTGYDDRPAESLRCKHCLALVAKAEAGAANASHG